MTFRTKLFTVLSSAWGIFIFSNSLKTGTQSSAVSSPIVEKIMAFLSLPIDVDIATTIVRKLAHLSEFLILGLLISLCFYYAKKRFEYAIPTILLLAMSIGVFDEFLQSFIVGRSSEVRDVLIDFAGGTIGLLIVYFMDKRRYKRSR